MKTLNRAWASALLILIAYAYWTCIVGESRIRILAPDESVVERGELGDLRLAADLLTLRLNEERTRTARLAEEQDE